MGSGAPNPGLERQSFRFRPDDSDLYRSGASGRFALILGDWHE